MRARPDDRFSSRGGRSRGPFVAVSRRYGPDDDHFAAKALSLARAYGVGMDVALRFWGPADGEAAAASRARAAFAKAGFEGLKFDAQPIVAKGEARFIEMEGSAPLS